MAERPPNQLASESPTSTARGFGGTSSGTRRPGTHRLQARATDNHGNTQPDRIALNNEGYSHWAVVTHAMTVT